MPIGRKARGGFLLPTVEWRKDTVRLDVLEANFFAKQAVVYHGYDVVDLNFHFRSLTHLRVKDDVHWEPVGHRKMSNIVLAHICDAWNIPKPRYIKTVGYLTISGSHSRAHSLPDSVTHHREFDEHGKDRRMNIHRRHDRRVYEKFLSYTDEGSSQRRFPGCHRFGCSEDATMSYHRRRLRNYQPY